MTLLALGLASVSGPLAFPDAPLGQVTDRGEYRRVIGKWFGGVCFERVEFVWWYSPRWVASRLGVLARREYWPEGEMSRRWDEIRRSVGRQVVFLVQLSATPKVDLLTQSADGRVDADRAERVRFVLTAGGKVIAPTGSELVWVERSRSPRIYADFPFYQFAPGGLHVTGEFEQPRYAQIYSLGDFHLYLYRVDFALDDVEPAASRSGAMTLHVLSSGKERTATYNL